MSSADVGSKRSRVSLGALKPLAPYALAHRTRIVLALIALAIASAATLVVPIAVRRMIDFGFSDSNAGLIRAYFLGMIGVVAICCKQELLLSVVGGVFVIEAVSVILQVLSFRLTGRRIFAMSPIHHHFELVGWKENTVIVRFWILSGIFALLGLATLKLR